MSSALPTSFSELLPELFPLISAELPLAYRLPTLLSLALTCHRLHDVVVPYLLYNNMRLVGEDQAIPILKDLTMKAGAVSKIDAGNAPPSHSIHHLCIDSEITTPLRSSYNSLVTLKNLIDVDGLRNLSALTLHVDGSWDGTEDVDTIEVFNTYPANFWQSLKIKCPDLRTINLTSIVQEFQKEWIESELFSMKELRSIYLNGYLVEYNPPNLDFSRLPQSLHSLKIEISQPHTQYINGAAPGSLLTSVLPHLRTLILDRFTISDPKMTKAFWKSLPDLERLEIGRHMEGDWFQDFEPGILRNLKFLKCNFLQARILLPHVSRTLIGLYLLETYNAQGAYLLRAISVDGILPHLRSLSINLESGNSPKPREGHRWREDENGEHTEADPKRPARVFDGNYLMSIAKAAPNLEELELMGNSNDTLDALSFSLSRMRKLARLTLSGPINGLNRPFLRFSSNWADYAKWDIKTTRKDGGPYLPDTFEVAALDLADGCRTLQTITIGNMTGDLVIKDGLSARIIRELEDGKAKEIKRIRAWGNIIGREEEW